MAATITCTRPDYRTTAVIADTGAGDTGILNLILLTDDYFPCHENLEFLLTPRQ